MNRYKVTMGLFGMNKYEILANQTILKRNENRLTPFF